MNIASVKYIDESETGIRVEYQNGRAAFFDSESNRRIIKKLSKWLKTNTIEKLSQADIDAKEATKKASSALRYLKTTDWMVLREVEEPSEKVPAPIKALRAQARIDANLI